VLRLRVANAAARKREIFPSQTIHRGISSPPSSNRNDSNSIAVVCIAFIKRQFAFSAFATDDELCAEVGDGMKG